jgi:D-alanyl-D-alanine carboxypeptidase/D-alanyl-D-alanine-endopeptidase (penicillin-binding protein 4)
MRLKSILKIFLLLISIHVDAQTLPQKLQLEFSKLEKDVQSKYATISLTVMDANTGGIIFSVNPDLGMAPASTLKTVTAATSFYLLGKDYKYQTVLGYNGNISADGILNGDLIVKGSGDPTLGSWRWTSTTETSVMTAWINAIKSAGIKQINGRIIGDDTLFGSQAIPDGWLWQDVGNYYGGGATALSWRENQFQVKVRPGKVNEPVNILLAEPLMPYLTIKSELITGAAGTGDLGFAYLPVLNNIMYIRGSYAVDQTKGYIALAIPDPAYDVAFQLKEALQRLSINVAGAAASSQSLRSMSMTAPVITQNLHVKESPELSKIIYWLNQKSVNLYAENLVKTFALQAGKNVSTVEGLKIMTDFWKDKGIDVASLNLFDGSGLSPRDRITGRSLTAILKLAKKEPWFNDFYQSFPLYNQMKMKSGSGNDILAFSGFHKNKNGQEFVFTIMINNYNGSTASMRQKLFRVLDVLK